MTILGIVIGAMLLGIAGWIGFVIGYNAGFESGYGWGARHYGRKP